MHYLETGDVLVKEGANYEKIVQGFVGDIVFTLDSDGDVETTTGQLLSEYGWKVKAIACPKELTVAEISKELGYEVKVVK